MAKKRRSFSVEQKLQIIQEADQNGVTQTLRKHNLSHILFSQVETSVQSGWSAIVETSVSQSGS